MHFETGVQEKQKYYRSEDSPAAVTHGSFNDEEFR
jgi:hypothetical protein